MAEIFHRSIFLAGQAGRIEATLWTAAGAQPRFAALVCHPHPLYGGTMHNKVVYQAAKTLHARGAPVLRFNFRGTGMSEGVHDGGQGEREDVRAGLDYLAGEYGGAPIVLAGFSFGAWVGLRVGCEDERVNSVIGLGLPVNSSDHAYLLSCAKAKLLVQGSNDAFGARATVEKVFSELAEPKKLVFVENADHFFSGHLSEMGAAIDQWLDETHAELLDDFASR